MSSSFRPATTVSPDHIRSLDEDGLRDVMSRLLRAEGHLCGIPANAIRVSHEFKAGDEGCDGWSPAHQGGSDWLPDVDTCWQLKSGKAGEPAKLKGEVLKPVPLETLASGGAYIVVASDASGETAARSRLDVLRREAEAEGLPTDRIRVYTCENLAAWCNSFSSISTWLADVPHGLLIFEEWTRDELYAGPFHVSPKVAGDIDRARQVLDFRHESSPFHLHIAGQPGVGRTRLALEIVRGTRLQEFTLYSPTFDPQIVEFLGQVRDDLPARLLLIVDQVPAEAVAPSNQQVRLADGRIRLVTIASELPVETEGIEILNLARLDADEMRKLILKQSREFPVEHIEFVTRFSDGFVKLAWIVWRALQKNPDVRGLETLLDQNDIRGFLDRLLGGLSDDDRRALEVVSLMLRVGWDGELDNEGKALVKLLGLDWRDIRGRIRMIQERLGIVPQAGRYRYVSPQPLAALLARGALDDYRDELPQLPERLPSHSARIALFRRLAQVSDHSVAEAMCRELLSGFNTLRDLERWDASERWDIAAATVPDVAVQVFGDLLDRASPAEKASFVGNAFSPIWTLAKLAGRAEHFESVMIMLADLAVVERRQVGYSPTRTFCDRFQVIQGGTEVPFNERLRVLDHPLDRRDLAYTRLVIRALTVSVSTLTPPIILDGNRGLRPIPPSWNPRDVECMVQARREALARLLAIARQGAPEHEELLAKAAQAALPLARSIELVDAVRELVERMVESYPGYRQPLLSMIAHLIEVEDVRRDGVPSSREALQDLHDAIADRTFGGRLRRHASHVRFGLAPPPAELDRLIAEIIENPDLLLPEWEWLTSGGAHNVSEVGRNLGQRDQHGSVESTLVRREGRGPDLRLVAAYVVARAEQQPPGWLDDWLEGRASEAGGDPELVLAVIREGAPSTARSARLVLRMLRDGSVPPAAFDLLIHCRWGRDLPGPEFRELVEELVRYPELRWITFFGISARLQQHPDDVGEFSAVTLPLVTDPTLLDSKRLSVWQGVARHFIRDHPRDIARTALTARREDPGFWSLPEAHDEEILLACAATDPEGVWEELSRSLEDPDGPHAFVDRLPIGLVDRLPQERVLGWAEGNPGRVILLAHLAAPDFHDDRSLAANLADLHGDQEDVSRTLIGQMLGRSPYRIVWQQCGAHAEVLERVARTTARSGLRRWASRAAQALRELEATYRTEEEENRMLP